MSKNKKKKKDKQGGPETEAQKRGRLQFSEKTKSTLKHGGIDLGAAIVGGVIGHFLPGWLSGFGGIAAIFYGHHRGNTHIATAGAVMMTTVTLNLMNANFKTAPNGKFDTQTELHNGKERAKMYLSALASKFYLDRLFSKKKDEENPEGEGSTTNLSGVGDGDMDALDALTRSLEASAADFYLRQQEGLPSADMSQEIPQTLIQREEAMLGFM